MRLLIATPLYPPEPGGPATYAKLLEEELPSRGIEVTVVKFSDVRHLPKLVRHLAYRHALLRQGKRADMILALDPVSTGLPAALAAGRLRKSFVLKVVGDYAWEQGQQRFGLTMSLDEFARTGRAPLSVTILRSIETWVARRARRVIVPSDYLKRIVGSWGIAEERIAVVPNAVTTTEPGSVPEAVRVLSHPRIVSVARLVPWKHTDRLIEAVANLRKEGKDASLIIVGDGPERRRLEKLATGCLGSGYAFTGLLTPPDVRAMLAESDIFALNSSYEGLSHALIEAAVAGLPTVATRAGGNAEVVTEGSGILIPVGDTRALTKALGELVGDAKLRERLSQGARERAQAFTVPAMIERTKAVLESIA